MKTLYPKLAALLFVTLITSVYISCKKGVNTDIIGNSPITTVDDLTKVVASVQGYVTNENGLPVNGAIVTCGITNATTDTKGYFRFNNIQLSKNNGYVKVTMPGYFTGSRSFITNEGRVNHVLIKLIPKTNAGNIDAAAGGSITLSSGIVISLPAGSVVKATNNAAYTGTVKVAAAWINPTSLSINEEMPGDLRGITANRTEAGLQTFGMVAVELTGSSGELLQIAAGKKATINFPIPGSIASYAPNTIPLWYFDETAGRWKEEGSATKNGNTYIASVSHFSFWNCDMQFPGVLFSATLQNASGKPVINAQVRIKRLANAFGYGITDSSGFVSGFIPANEALVFEVFDRCGVTIYSQNIGPLSAKMDLGIITVSSPSLLTISGTLTNCNNQPVTNGYVEILLNNRFYKTPVNNGNYTATVINCSGITSGSLYGVDNSVNQQNALQIFTVSSTNVIIPAMQACATSSLQFIDYTVDGISYSIKSPPDTVSCYNTAGPPGSGNGFYYGYISGTKTSITFAFSGLDGIPGTYPLTFLAIANVDSSVMVFNNPTATITQYGGLGQFVVGSFSGQVKSMINNSIHPVTGSFRIRRK